MEGVHVHLYGKAVTKPWRKMGHVTVCSSTMEEAMAKAVEIKSLIKVVS
jgi:5-(carboxyamino)imidazole ribonucleotide synthase